MLLPISAVARAQDTTAAHPAMPATPTVPTAASDTSTYPRGGVRPLPAFFRSLLIPGWSQAKLDRKLTAGLFVMWEGVTLGMMLKANQEVTYLMRSESLRLKNATTAADSLESPRLHDKRTERQDWLVLLLFNHLFSGMEAYVSANLWDFPGDLHFEALPHGVGATMRIPVRLP